MPNVLDWLEKSARLYPAKTFVSSPDSSISYERTLKLARESGSWLAKRGLPRQAVALYLEKSIPALCCMLGVVYAGDYYSVLDVRQPASRIRATCEKLNPLVILTDEANIDKARDIFDGTGWQVALLASTFGTNPNEALLARRRAEAIDVDPLYVNFTSGSTGTPKGVVVSQRSVLDFIPVFCHTFGIDNHDVLANQAPFDFDVSVKDIYSALYTGARLAIVPREYFSVPTKLMDFLANEQVTTAIWAVSALCFVSIMRGFDYRVPTTINKVLFSGEIMPPKQLRIWQSYLPDATYVNLYGPTEITCNCTYFIVNREYKNDETIPIGNPFPNERVFLLGENNDLISEPAREGEICVSGTALGLGYLNEPERTAKTFVQNPLQHDWLEPVYRTGDIGHYDDNGNLVYDSRLDNQIKRMGQRIELGDIESATQAVDGIERACCLYDARRKKLTLYYLGDVEKKTLVAALEESLPSFMLPNKTIPVNTMPLTKNGKIDRRALAALS